MSARGPVPSLAEAIAGGPIRGSWWGHPKGNQMYRVFEAVRDSDQVLVCRLVMDKVTFVHRRLWPALVRIAGRLPRRRLAAIREEHTARGAHRTVVTAFPRWVPKEVLGEAKRLDPARAVSMFGPAAAGVLEDEGRGVGRARAGPEARRPLSARARPDRA